jgi:hypothetical protein
MVIFSPFTKNPFAEDHTTKRGRHKEVRSYRVDWHRLGICLEKLKGTKKILSQVGLIPD